jgi:hypothetical protein
MNTKFSEKASIQDNWKMFRGERFEILRIGKDRYLESVYNDLAVRRKEVEIRFHLKLA